MHTAALGAAYLVLVWGEFNAYVQTSVPNCSILAAKSFFWACSRLFSNMYPGQIAVHRRQNPYLWLILGLSFPEVTLAKLQYRGRKILIWGLVKASSRHIFCTRLYLGPKCSIYAALFFLEAKLQHLQPNPNRGLFEAFPSARPHLALGTKLQHHCNKILVLTVGPCTFLNRGNLVAISPASASVLSITIAEAAFAKCL